MPRFYIGTYLMAINMAFCMNSLLSNIKTRVCSCIRFGCQSACDYPVVLGAGFVLLFLHKLCPSLFAFLLSSSPVILLTALLLGALLSYGEPSAPAIGEETLENQQILPHKSKISIANCSVEKVENVDEKVCATMRSQSQVIYTVETISGGIWHGTHYDAENGIPVPSNTNTILCAESSELAKSNVNVEREQPAKEICENVQVQKFEEENVTSVSADTVICAETSGFAKNKVIVEREESVKEICDEKVELQHFVNNNCERCHYEMNNQYQFGELMSSCWQPVMKHEPCSDSESDLTESSSDASITDIIPMLDELNPSANLGTDNPSSNFRDNLNSSSDDDENDSEDGNVSSNEDVAEKQKGGGNNWKEFVDSNSSDMENNENLESLMERRKAKNILKFELDRRLMDMQATDAIQKMEEASRFRVQVPSISTPRPNMFDPSNGPEEIVELPQIPDSAPSVLLPWRKPFDVPFDQIVDRGNSLQETWTPRSCFPSTQHRKHDNFCYLRQSTYVRHHNSIKPEKSEVSEKDASGDHSDSEQEWNNGKLFGSLESHVGDEIKILSAAISDVCVLEVNHGTNEGTKNTNSINGTDSFYIQKSISSTAEVNDSVDAGCEHLLLCSLSEEYSTEKHINEADSISEVNSFKCRMEEVLVQSISESSIDQPFAGKLEHGLNDTLSTESAMPVIEARSVEELNSQFAQPNGEALECAASDSSCDNEPIQYRSSESLPVENGHTPVAVMVQCKSEELFTEDSELPVLEASSVEEMNSTFKQLEDEEPTQMSHSLELTVGEHNGETDSGVLVPDANSREGISSAFVHLSTNDDKMEIPGDGEVILHSAELNSRLHFMKNNALGSDDRSRSDSTKGIEV